MNLSVTDGCAWAAFLHLKRNRWGSLWILRIYPFPNRVACKMTRSKQAWGKVFFSTVQINDYTEGFPSTAISILSIYWTIVPDTVLARLILSTSPRGIHVTTLTLQIKEIQRDRVTFRIRSASRLQTQDSHRADLTPGPLWLPTWPGLRAGGSRQDCSYTWRRLFAPARGVTPEESKARPETLEVWTGAQSGAWV